MSICVCLGYRFDVTVTRKTVLFTAILLSYAVLVCHAEQSEYVDFTKPNHLHQINLQKNDKISGYLSINYHPSYPTPKTSNDYQLIVYISDVLVDSNIVFKRSGTLSYFGYQGIGQQASETSLYSIKVNIINKTNTQEFSGYFVLNLKIQSNDPSVADETINIQQAFVYSPTYFPSGVKQQFSTNFTQSIKNYQMRIELSQSGNQVSPFTFNVVYRNSQGLIQKKYKMVENQQICLPERIYYSPSIIAEFPKTQQTPYKILNYKVAFQQNDSCSECTTQYEFDSNLQYCNLDIVESIRNNRLSQTNVSTQQSSSVGMIAGIVGGVCGVILLTLAIAIIYIKRKKLQGSTGNIEENNLRPQNQIQNQYQNSIQNNEISSGQNLRIEENIPCSICLNEACDTLLKCKHPFHKICITDWFKKNRICPLCRLQISSV